VSRFGEADRMRRDCRERPRRGGRERDTWIAEEDGVMQHRVASRVSLTDLRRGERVGRRGAGRGHLGQRPSAGADPRRAQRDALDMYKAGFGNAAADKLRTSCGQAAESQAAEPRERRPSQGG
jgi:hypothetical protein